MITRSFTFFSIATALLTPAYAANEVAAAVQFDRKLQAWDGFGIHYVEVAQTRDYLRDPQEYGGFSTLSEAQRGEILDLIFGPEGLWPALAKMFLDPHHQASPRAPFDHATTTR